MKQSYQVGIIGAGLAGLSLAIQLSSAGHSVVLFEKSSFPFHKLCGEYLSRESEPFLRSLGLDIDAMKPAQIDQLQITNASGKKLTSSLNLGGLGISRWTLDFEMYQKAKEVGAEVMEKTLVLSSEYVDGKHVVQTKQGKIQCEILISSFGKKSNLSGLNRHVESDANQYLGVKYHVRNREQPEHLISIHNFSDGYCGVCRLEKDWVSVCYLSHTKNLTSSGNNIQQMEREILFKNKEIKKVFEHSEFLYQRPITVSNIEFKKKKLVHDHVLYVGDAAGLITPLCGNGMSMSLHGSYILGKLVLGHLRGKVSQDELFARYSREWERAFSTRMAVGRSIQKLFRREKTADIAVTVLNLFPIFNRQIIGLTHGSPFY